MRTLFFITLLLSLTGPARAADVSVVGLFPGKAVLVVDGGTPKTYSVGASVGSDAKLVAVNDSGAIIEMNGKRQTIALGGHVNRQAASGPASVTLSADSRGHFMTQGQINGGSMRLLVDTGASNIALPASDAIRLGIDYKKGQRGYSQTANGVSQVYLVKLDTVKIGDVVLNQVDATVHEGGGLTVGLLGMSFLNRTEMRREGEQMTLIKRY
jgi:aspartyl protease family protein